MGDLRNKTIKGIFWTTVESGFLQLSRFVLVIYMARLLSPSDYGLIAMITIFITVGEAISNSGIKSSIIRNRNINQVDLSTAFYFNILVSTFIYFILFFTSKQVSVFFNEPQLVLLIKVVALNIIFDSFGIVQTAIANQRMDFKLLTIIQIASVIIGGGVGISLAYMNYGVWALVGQTLVNNFLKNLIIWFIQKWTPSLKFSFKSLKTMLRFGINILLGNLIDKIFMQLSTVVIGKFYSSADLGYYHQGKRIQGLPSNSINDIVRKVSYPVFAKIQDDDIKMKMGFKLMLKTLVFLNFPLMMLIIVIANTFISVVMTDKWLPAVPYLQLLCIVGIMSPFNSLNVNIIIAKGFSNLALRLEFFKKAVMVIAILITVKIGIIAIIIGEVVTSVIAYFVNSYYPGKLAKYTVCEQLKDILPYLSASFFMAILVFVTKSLLPLHNFIGLVILTILGLGIYIGVSYFFKFEALLLVIDSVKKLRNKQK